MNNNCENLGSRRKNSKSKLANFSQCSNWGWNTVSYLMVNNYLWEELRKYRITMGEIVVWLMYSCWSRLQTINYFVPFNTPTLVSALEIM